MPARTSYETGEFCWTELATSDPAAAKDFYSSLFGWEVDDEELPEGMGVYTTFRLRGKAVAAATPQGPDQTGVPPHWNLYMNVDDVDIHAKKAEAAGGTIVVQPMDVMELGRMAVVSDPTGAILGLWQANSMAGAELDGEAGTFAWPELLTNDVDTATSFLTEVFGYDKEIMQMPDAPPYTVLKVNDKSAAGVMSPPTEGMPNFWTAYFNVDDCAATEAKAVELGASVMLPTTAVPTVGKFAWFSDPQGATFAVLEPEPAAQQ